MTGGLADVSCPDVFAAKPVGSMLRLRERILGLVGQGADPAVLVVGGGAAGVEVAGSACSVLDGRGDRVCLAAGPQLMPAFIPKARRLALRSLTARGIRVLPDESVTELNDGTAVLSSGGEEPFDVVVLTMGLEPPDLFRTTDLPVAADGGLLVDRCLQCPSRPGVFGAGDCVTMQDGSLPRTGAMAVRMAPTLVANVLAHVEGREPQPFLRGRMPLQIINLCDGTAIAVTARLALRSRLALRIKRRIDRRFIARFRRP